ncbi:MAG: DNA repair exonuclease [Firmicutes bacterium]|nr:DNA repair exonuclease [Bacillota bacterium]
MLKVLHTGDLHLGMTHRTRNYPEELRQQLVDARFSALAKLVELANQECCQLFLIAGDLFHSHNVSKNTVLRTVKILQTFAGACIAVLPGNHDYYNDSSAIWRVFLEHAPEHVLLLMQQKPYCLQEYGLDAVLYPAPCDRKHSAENRLGWLRDLQEKPAAQWQLGIAHGTVRGLSPDLEENYFPMERDELFATGLHHWFLGHAHVRYPDLEKADSCGFTYCGTPEPDGFDCRHQGYAWLATCHDGKVEHRAVRTGKFRFIDTTLEIKELNTVGNYLKEIAADTTLVKLRLHGRLPQEQFRQRGAYLQQCADSVRYLEYDDSMLKMELSPESIEAEFPAGSFPYLLLTSLAAEGEYEALQLAYELVKKVKK